MSLNHSIEGARYLTFLHCSTGKQVCQEKYALGLRHSSASRLARGRRYTSYSPARSLASIRSNFTAHSWNTVHSHRPTRSLKRYSPFSRLVRIVRCAHDSRLALRNRYPLTTRLAHPIRYVHASWLALPLGTLSRTTRSNHYGTVVVHGSLPTLGALFVRLTL